MESNGKSSISKREITDIVDREISGLVNSGLIHAKDMDAYLLERVAQLDVEKKELKDNMASLQEKIKEYEKAGDPSQNEEIKKIRESLKEQEIEIYKIGNDKLTKANEIKQEAEQIKQKYEAKMTEPSKENSMKETDVSQEMAEIENQYKKQEAEIKDKYQKDKSELISIISNLEDEMKNKDNQTTELIRSIKTEAEKRDEEHVKKSDELNKKLSLYDAEKIANSFNEIEISKIMKENEEDRKALSKKVLDARKQMDELNKMYEQINGEKQAELSEIKEKYMSLSEKVFLLEKTEQFYHNKLLEEKITGKKEDSQYDEKMLSQLEELGKNLNKLGKNFKKLQQDKNNEMYQKIEKIDKNLDYIMSKVKKPEAVASGAKNE